ncbi:MAG: winged helix DNA-binding protein [Alphaproteobacteria bacterium]|nr:winged helix DNA-binding protein [Alphaproteobacteria bacterium]
MVHPELLDLFENIMMTLSRLNERIKDDIDRSIYSKQQLMTIVRLHLGGRARLKDIAKREMVPTSNLCLMLKNLEHDDLVMRSVDEADRRNTWYSLTPKGEKLARDSLRDLRARLAKMFVGIDKKDEQKMIGALYTMNEVLNKIWVRNQ